MINPESAPSDKARFFFEQPLRVQYGGYGHSETVDMIRFRADNAAEMMNVIRENRAHATHGDYAEDNDFHGRRDITTFARFVEEVSLPWVRGLNSFDALKAKIEPSEMPKPVHARRRSRWSEDSGEEVSIDRYRSGDPFWRSVEPLRTQGPKVVTVTIDMGASASIPAEALAWRGIAGTLIVEILEAAGYRVEVRCHSLSTLNWVSDYTTHRMVDWQVKAPGQPLDVSQLVNMTSGWFFRIGVFDAYHAQPRVNTMGLGRPQLMSHYPGLLEQTGGRGSYVVENCFNQEAAREVVLRVLKDFTEIQNKENQS